jgi:hypothetical protein
LHRDAFIIDEIAETTVALDAPRGDSDLEELDLRDAQRLEPAA